ncbi:MAG: hypothetical protein ACR2OZ_00160 [Verrucomicrobiales bacterium]
MKKFARTKRVARKSAAGEDVPRDNQPAAHAAESQPVRQHPGPAPRDPRQAPREGTFPEPRHEREQRYGHRDQRPEPSQHRVERQLDGRELSDRAWQLFAGELREEGIELVDDSEAEKLSNRCFRLAEIFLRTRQRRLNQLQQGGGYEDRRREEWRPQQKREERPVPAPRPPEEREQVSREQAEAVIEQAHEQAAKVAQEHAAPL